MIVENIGPEIVIAVSQVSDGNIDPRFGRNEEVERNLKAMLSRLGCPRAKIVQGEQVHKTNVVSVGRRDEGRLIPDTDGMVTDRKEIVLLLRVADCIPAFLIDDRLPAIGLIHIGWRGAIGKIGLVAIERMMRDYGTNPQDIRVVLGPSILRCCNLQTTRPLQAELPEWQAFIEEDSGRYVVDIQGFVVETMIEAGVSREKIRTSDLCTVEDKRFFSHTHSLRGGKPEGRNAALIALLPKQ